MKKDDTSKESGKHDDKVPAKATAKKQKQNYKGKKELTASQLRNARKRRSRAATKTTTTTTTTASHSPSASSVHHSQKQQQQQQQHDDPSLRYISNPRQAPIVQKAIQFFAQHQPAATSQFPVVLSAPSRGNNPKQESSVPRKGEVPPAPQVAAAATTTTTCASSSSSSFGWRTVAKLAVRANRQGRITIGLFRQKSHDVLDATNCPAHHPSINRAVQCLQEICRRRNLEPDNHGNSNVVDHDGTSTIPAYSEQSGQGCFRYVQCQVERATGAVQITLVWRKDPQYDDALKYLCQEIIMTSSSSSASSSSSSTSPGVATKHNYSNGKMCGNDDGGFLLHSLWVHYNNAGKHENSIVSRSASVNTMECHGLDELHNLGQDGSWVHITTTTGASTLDDTKDMNGTILLPGVVVERLDNVVLKPWVSGNDHDDGHDDDDHSRRKPQLLSVPLHFAPNVFRQANLDGFAAIVAKIRSYFQSHLEKQQQRPQQSVNLVELYGGAGTIGLHLADLCTSLVCSDENPYNHSCFQAAVNGMQWSSHASSSTSLKKKAKKKHKKHRKNSKDEDSKNGNVGAAPPAMIRYEPISATAMVQNVELFRDADWIVVDPPRKGLDEAVIQALCRDHGLHHRESHAQQQQQQQRQQVLVYVSCGFDAFQRDFGQITTMGKPWKLQHSEGHILFPGSDAIEVLAFFTR